jgi:hypothetical protein
MKVLIAIGLLMALLLAGCMSGDDRGKGGNPTPDPEPVRPVMPEDPMPEGAGHDHTDVSQHKFLWNYAFSARDAMLQNQANIAGVHALDLKAEHLFGAVYGSHAASIDGGLVIWSLADPTNPVETGRWIIPGAVGGDRSVQATMDGEYAVIGLETVSCLGQVNPTAARAYLIDTRDKSRPVVADTVTITGSTTGSPQSVSFSLGTHSVFVHRFNETDYAFLSGSIYRIDRPEGQPAKLVATGSSVPTGHDLYIRDTPWGSVWALTANGERNFQIFDVTDPMAPVEIASFESQPGHYLHTADVAFHDDGRVTVILSSEDWTDVVSPMWVFDATHLKSHDLSREAVILQPIGMWQNPGNHTALGTSFSLHNPRFHDGGILTISSYHGGLWQLDFRHPNWRADPAEIAYAVYAEGERPLAQDPIFQLVESQLCGLGLTLDTPTVMDVEVGPGGILYGADVYMGLYTFVPTADHPVYGSAASKIE